MIRNESTLIQIENNFLEFKREFKEIFLNNENK